MATIKRIACICTRLQASQKVEAKKGQPRQGNRRGLCHRVYKEALAGAENWEASPIREDVENPHKKSCVPTSFFTLTTRLTRHCEQKIHRGREKEAKASAEAVEALQIACISPTYTASSGLETLEKAIKRQVTDILKDFFDPALYYGLLVDITPIFLS